MVYKIDTAGATVTNEFRDYQAGVQTGTTLSADYMNMIQRELLALLTAASMAPDKTNNHQVRDAINYLISLASGGGGGGSAYWKDAVATPGSLPGGASTGSIALAISDLTLYRYNGSTWVSYITPALYALAATAATKTGSETLTNKTLTAPVINSPTGIVKGDVGLGNVDNTADASKPVSTAQATAIALKQSLSEKGQVNGYAGLDGSGKVPTAQLPATVLGNVHYKGALDASGGAYPASPTQGDYYIVSVSGTISGTSYAVSDWAIYNGTSWDKIDNTDAVTSVDGMMGAVVLSGVYQASSAQLAAIAALGGTGLVRRTGTNTFDIVPYIPGYTPSTTTANPSPAANNTHYLCNTSSGAFSVTLPAGSTGAKVKLQDDRGTWDVNNLTITPASGERIWPLAVNASLVCNVIRGWIELVWDGSGWSPNSLASTSLSKSGGLTGISKSANYTAVSGDMVEANTSSAGWTLTLPPGTSAAAVGFMDVGGAVQTSGKELLIAPATGQAINLNGIIVTNDTLTVEVNYSSGILYRDEGSTTWTLQKSPMTLYSPGSVPGYTGSTAIAAGNIGEKIAGTFSGAGVSAAANLTTFTLQPGVHLVLAKSLTQSASAGRRAFISISTTSATQDTNSQSSSYIVNGSQNNAVPMTWRTFLVQQAQPKRFTSLATVPMGLWTSRTASMKY